MCCQDPLAFYSKKFCYKRDVLLLYTIEQPTVWIGLPNLFCLAFWIPCGAAPDSPAVWSIKLTMMEAAGLKNIRFSEKIPFWCAVGYARGMACAD